MHKDMRLKTYIKRRYADYLLRAGRTPGLRSVRFDRKRDSSGRKGPPVPAGYLVNQASGPEGRYRYGVTRTAHTGCEIIAVYNLLYRCGIRRDYGELVRQFDRRRAGRVLLGLFGTTVCGMRQQLERSGVSVRCIPGDQTEEMDHAGAGILSFWWSESSLRIHTVMIEKDQRSGRVIAYNFEPWSGACRVSDRSVSALVRHRGIRPIAFLAVK